MTLKLCAEALDKAAVGAMVAVVGRYTLDILLDSEQRSQNKQLCAERIRRHDAGYGVAYAEQAILANLDWGIDALEEAIRTTNNETKTARLNHAEKMLQVCALLDHRATTAGVPNNYLSAWAHLNLAFVSKLRDHDLKAANHMLEMFLVDPLYSRVDFAPSLWEHLFFPHLTNIVNWYTRQRQHIFVSGSLKHRSEEMDCSFSRDSAPYSEMISLNSLTLTADQTAQLQALEKLYQDSLDENTRQFSRYYKDWLNYDPVSKRGKPLMPIAEPPVTPMLGLCMPPPATKLDHEQDLSQKSSSFSMIKRSIPPLETVRENREFSPVDHRGQEEDMKVIHEEIKARFMTEDDVDSPHSNFRKPATEEEIQESTPYRGSKDVDGILSDFETKIKPNLQPGRNNLKGNQNFPRSVRTSSADSGFPTAEQLLPEPSRETSAPAEKGNLELQAGRSMRRNVIVRHSSAATGFPPEEEVDLPASAIPVPAGRAFWESSLSRRKAGEETVKAPNLTFLARCKSGRYSELGASFTKNVTDNLLYKSSESPRSSLSSILPSNPLSRESSFSSDGEDDIAPPLDVPTVGVRGSFNRIDSNVTCVDDESCGSILVMSTAFAVPSESPTESPGSPADSLSTRDQLDYQENFGMPSECHRVSDEQGELASDCMKPPKDFVCPITSQLFNDPVTLETGQTYERKAIQEWMDRGNSSCPITRQMLHNANLPKTNYVLKRLVDGWKDQNPQLAAEFGSTADFPVLIHAPQVNQFITRSIMYGERSPDVCSPCSISPASSIESSGQGRPSRRFSKKSSTTASSCGGSPSNIDVLICDLKPAIACLCTSDSLVECEVTVLEIARIWQESKGDSAISALLTKAGVIDGLIEVLSNSETIDVLKVGLYLVSSLIAQDDFCRDTVMRSDPDVECLLGLVRKGLSVSLVVLYQLKLPVSKLMAPDFVLLLLRVIKQSYENKSSMEQDFPTTMSSRSAAVMLLEQIVTGGDEITVMRSGEAILSSEVVPALISSLEAIHIDERTSAVSLLLRCMQSDGHSRNMIAQMANLVPVVELLHIGGSSARTIIISFFADLVRMSRRTFCNEILQVIKSEGILNSLHVLLTHLQVVPMEQRPVAAGLLLQLDLLAEPRKRSMYRDEAVDVLLEALTCKEIPLAQIEAANTLLYLGGRFAFSGKPMMEASLLKAAAVSDKNLASSVKEEKFFSRNDSVIRMTDEEEKEALQWEKKVAGALVGHDMGGIIVALSQGLQSKIAELSKPCMIVASWLAHLIPSLPDTGVRAIAQKFLLGQFVTVLQTSKDNNVLILAALAMHSFIGDPGGVEQLFCHAKNISEPLRQLKHSTWVAKDILQVLISKASVKTPELWTHGEQGCLDSSSNGEVRSLVQAKGLLFSGHSDGCLKVWDSNSRNKFPVLIQENRDHTKSVTSLTVATKADRLYSGSLDKTIRVWALGSKELQCIHVFELKDAVNGLVVKGPMACIIPQSNGIKVQYEDTATKTLNSSKHVQSLCIAAEKIYCGCSDNSVQELDPLEGTIVSIQNGVRTLLGKKAIYAMHAYKDLLYAAGACLDGISAKVWKLEDHSLVGSLVSTAEVRSMAVSEDFVYLGCNTGLIEVWLRQRLVKLTSLNAGSKVTTLMHDGDVLYSGSEDGKIRIWTMM